MPATASRLGGLSAVDAAPQRTETDVNDVAAIEVARQGLLTLIRIGSPVMLAALVVGVTVALLQALTQIQEMTLAFVPKIIVVFLSLAFALPFMLATLTTFTEDLFARVAQLG